MQLKYWGLVGLFCSFSSVAGATTITVNTTTDELNSDGDCSLREAVRAAGTDAAVDGCPAGTAADVIVVPSGTFQLTIAGTDEDAAMTGDLDIFAAGGTTTIRGTGENSTIIDGNGIDRVFDLTATGTLNLERLTVTGGHIVSNDKEGGGIRAEAAGASALTLTRVTVHDNFLEAATAAGVQSGGGLAITSATLVIDESYFYNNRAGGPGDGFGGAVFSTATTATITRSTFDSNRVDGVAGGAALFVTGTPTISMCTITRNASYDGFGGAIFTPANAQPRIYATTIAANTSEFGTAGLVTQASADDTGPIIRSVLLADNVTTGSAFDTDLAGHVQSRGYNLIEFVGSGVLDVAGNGNTDTGNITDVDPALGTLAFTYGPTMTLSIAPPSAAIDAGACTDIAGATVSYDQRRVPRPQLGNCDIGSLEYAPGGAYATSVKSEPPGANCTLGGARLASGLDFNNNGLLDTLEERDVAYICTGSDGSNGTNGVSSLVLTTTLPVGDANCAQGGVRIDVGLDNGDGGGTANNGVLEAGEVDTTSYVCSGTNGADGANGANGADGAGCCDAGTRGAGGPMLLTVLAALWLRRRRRE